MLKSHSELSEKWVQERIAEDPVFLGLGDVILKDKERINRARVGSTCCFRTPRQTAGTKSKSSSARPTRPHHPDHRILGHRTEAVPAVRPHRRDRRRGYHQPLLNVISLFNGIDSAHRHPNERLRSANKFALVFTTVLGSPASASSTRTRRRPEVTDRAYWENRSSKETSPLADELLETRPQVRSGDGPSSTTSSTSVWRRTGSQTTSWSLGHARASSGLNRACPSLPNWRRSSKTLDSTSWSTTRGGTRYRIRLTKNDLKKHAELLTELLKSAHENSVG